MFVVALAERREQGFAVVVTEVLENVDDQEGVAHRGAVRPRRE